MNEPFILYNYRDGTTEYYQTRAEVEDRLLDFANDNEAEWEPNSAFDCYQYLLDLPSWDVEPQDPDFGQWGAFEITDYAQFQTIQNDWSIASLIGAIPQIIHLLQRWSTTAPTAALAQETGTLLHQLRVKGVTHDHPA